MPRESSLGPILNRFIAAESGAVTVDWVVLAAAITGLGIGAASLVRAGAGDLGADVSAALSGGEVASLDCLGANGGPAGFDCYDGPTIQSAGMEMFWASMPICLMTIDGTSSCSGGASGSRQSFAMSDGSTYIRNTRTENGETTTTWTDNLGNPVDEPPPMDSNRSDPGCWMTSGGYMVCT